MGSAKKWVSASVRDGLDGLVLEALQHPHVNKLLDLVRGRGWGRGKVSGNRNPNPNPIPNAIPNAIPNHDLLLPAHPLVDLPLRRIQLEARLEFGIGLG